MSYRDYQSYGERQVEQWKREARQHAEQQLKELVQLSYAKRTPESGPLGEQILQAVEALPDYTKFHALPTETQDVLKKYLVQMEIRYAADATIAEIDKLEIKT